MTLGEKIRLARLDAGLSQRQLCGDVITRNMLSQIEHGTAKPSVKTLQYLASKLEKPMAYFLEDRLSPNEDVMETARAAYDGADFAAAWEALKRYRQPDHIYDREKARLEKLTVLSLAESAAAQGREPYARELLELGARLPYASQESQRRTLLLRGRLEPENLPDICKRLPDLDEELILRAKGALFSGNPRRAAQLLDAAENQAAPLWCLIRGQTCMAQGEFSHAARHFHGAESAYSKDCAAHLETCYRELGDFKKAYFYACKQREK